MALSDNTSVPQDNGQTAYNYFVSQGLSPVQAAGIVGNLQGESGQGLDPNSVNRGDGTDGSDSIGIGQWNGARAQALKAYAASQGVPWTDLNTQLQFLNSELQGPESGAYSRLKAAQTPEEAGQAMLAYERPKDWNKSGAHPERARYAARAFAAYGGGMQPGAQGEPASPPAPANSPLVTPQQQPIFAQPQAAPSPQMAQAQQAQAPQIYFAPRKQIDLSGLQQALAQRMPIFARQDT